MLTPTGVTSAQYWEAIKAGNPTHIRISFEDQNITLEDADINLNEGLTLTDIFNGDTDLIMGKALSKQITVGIMNSSKLEVLTWTREFKLEMGVEIGSPAVTNWVTIGYFTGEKPNGITVNDVIEFTAYDRMKQFDILADKFVAQMTYPATVQDIYDGLCAFVGITNDAGDELPNIMARNYVTAPVEFTGYTCRDVLAWIAEASGCYAKINAAGHVQLKWFTDNTGHIVTGNEEFDVESIDIYEGIIWNDADQMTWDEADFLTWDVMSGVNETYKIDQLMVQNISTEVQVNYPTIAGSNVYLIVDNPFLTIQSVQDRTDYVVPLYNRLNAFGGYFPVKVDCIGSWLVEAGDVVTIHVFEHILPIPVFMKTMKWNGATNDSYEATGNAVRSVYSNEKNRQKVINNKEVRLYVGENYYEKVSGIGIDENGVEIVGNQHVQIYAGHEYNKWTFDGEGLTYECHAIESDVPSPGDYVTFGIAQFTGETVPNSEGGIYPQFNSAATYLNLLLKAWKSRNDSYDASAFLHLEAVSTYKEDEYDDEGNQICLYTDKINGNVTGRIGDENHYWRDAFVENIYYAFAEQTSSRNLKDGIKALPDGGEAIDKLNPVSFHYKADKRKRKVYGLIYEETAEVMPDICSQTGEKDEDKHINYLDLIPVLLKEVQSLRKRVAELESIVRQK